MQGPPSQKRGQQASDHKETKARQGLGLLWELPSECDDREEEVSPGDSAGLRLREAGVTNGNGFNRNGKETLP